MALGDDENGIRLSKIEGEVQGIRNGQQALREHLDNGIGDVKLLIREGQQEQSISAQTWALLLLAASNSVISLIVVIFLVDYYFS